MAKKSVLGIGKIRKMESSGDFEVEKVVEVINANKDIIRKVESDGEDSISIYLNLRATKDKLVGGIVEMYDKFNARSVDLHYDKGIRILKFWWDSSARNF